MGSFTSSFGFGSVDSVGVTEIVSIVVFGSSLTSKFSKVAGVESATGSPVSWEATIANYSTIEMRAKKVKNYIN